MSRSRGEAIVGDKNPIETAERSHPDSGRRDSEELLRATLDSTADGIIVVSKEGHLLTANARFGDLWNIPKEILSSAEHKQPLIEIALEQLEDPDQFKARIAEVYDSSAESFDSIRLKDGRVFERFSRPLIRDGEEVGRVWSFRDVTERKRADQELQDREEQYRLLAENVRDLIWTLDLEGRFTYMSPSVSDILGYTPEEALTLTRDQLLPPASLEEGTAAHEDLLKLEETGRRQEASRPHILEQEVRRKDGSTVPIETAVDVLRNSKGEMVGFLGVTRDITERKRAEEKSKKLEAQIQHAQKLESLGLLAGGIAHDFNNLLTSILGNADLALMKLTPESLVHDTVQQIKTSAIRAAELTNQMLAYSGRGQFVIEKIDLSLLVQEMAQLLEVFVSKTAQFEYDFASQLPPIEADPAQIRQVVMNLITNASEAIGKPGGLISISTGTIMADRQYLEKSHAEEELLEGNYVYVSVSDNGIGMSPTDVEKIFDPFFTTKFAGRGLGLAAVLGIVRGHKGAIKVSSTRGKGTTFRVLFPASDWVAVNDSPQERLAPFRQSTGTILVVDDEESVLRTTSRMLQYFGFTVVATQDAREGIRIYRERRRDIAAVLLDMTMPQLNGEATFREIRSVDPKAKIILMSGYTEQDATSRFANKGLTGFIQKPFQLRQLFSQLQETLRETS